MIDLLDQLADLRLLVGFDHLLVSLVVNIAFAGRHHVDPRLAGLGDLCSIQRLVWIKPCVSGDSGVDDCNVNVRQRRRDQIRIQFLDLQPSLLLLMS